MECILFSFLLLKPRLPEQLAKPSRDGHLSSITHWEARSGLAWPSEQWVARKSSADLRSYLLGKRHHGWCSLTYCGAMRGIPSEVRARITVLSDVQNHHSLLGDVCVQGGVWHHDQGMKGGSDLHPQDVITATCHCLPNHPVPPPRDLTGQCLAALSPCCSLPWERGTVL